MILCPHCGKPYAPAAPTLTPAQLTVLKAVAAHVASQGVSPTFEELARACNYRSIASAHGHVDALIRKGYLTRDRDGQARNLQVLVEPDHIATAAEHGGARAGSGPKSNGRSIRNGGR